MCLFIIFGLFCLGITSCALHRPTEKDFVGLWVEDSDICQGSNICGSFEFFPDGSFYAQNIPDIYFGYVPTFTNTSRINGLGTWQLEVPDDLLRDSEINLYFDHNQDIGNPPYNSVLYSSNWKEYNLFTWLGDESDRIVFKKDNRAITQTPEP